MLDSSFEKDSHCIWDTGKSCVSPVFHLQSLFPSDSSNPPPGKLERKSMRKEATMI